VAGRAGVQDRAGVGTTGQPDDIIMIIPNEPPTHSGQLRVSLEDAGPTSSNASSSSSTSSHAEVGIQSVVTYIRICIYIINWHAEDFVSDIGTYIHTY